MEIETVDNGHSMNLMWEFHLIYLSSAKIREAAHNAGIDCLAVRVFAQKKKPKMPIIFGNKKQKNYFYSDDVFMVKFFFYTYQIFFRS